MTQSTSSQQYQTVLQSWDILARRLSSAEAETGLLRQFYMKQWLDTTDKTNTDGMIRLALNKIEADVKNYGVFIEMYQEYTLWNMSIPWVWSLVYTGYIHEPIPLKLGYKIRLALNKRIRTCEDEKGGGGGGGGGGG